MLWSIPFAFASLLVAAVGALIPLLLVYLVIRLAVRHGIRDVQRENDL